MSVYDQRRFTEDVVIDGEQGRHRLRVQRTNGRTTVVCRTCKETLLEMTDATAAAVEAAVENHV